jgi:hypothetical protein
LKRSRKNVEFRLSPKVVDVGERWLTLHLKNLSDVDLRDIDVRLNSYNTLGLEVKQSSKYMPLFRVGEEINLYFMINIVFSTPLYVSMTGYRGEELFYWETPAITIRVRHELAEISMMFAKGEPQTKVGNIIKVSTTVASFKLVDELDLEVWIEAPDGEIEEVEMVSTGKLKEGDVKEFISEFKPEKKGVYTVHSELFQGIKKISSKVDYVLVEES